MTLNVRATLLSPSTSHTRSLPSEYTTRLPLPESAGRSAGWLVGGFPAVVEGLPPGCALPRSAGTLAEAW
ncbi:hypothetical protein SALBM311S_05648 [Streptomyces alboniger]